MELESASLSCSDQLASNPPLQRSFRIPLHANLPKSEWRQDARAGVADALAPVTKLFPQLGEFMTATDWPLACLLHPTAVPKGPLRSTFAMPQAVSTLGASWAAVAWQACALERGTGKATNHEAQLLQWMRRTSLDTLLVFDSTVFVPPTDGDAATLAAVPPVVIIPSAICLLGMVWRETGDSGAALLLEQMQRQ